MMKVDLNLQVRSMFMQCLRLEREDDNEKQERE
jgi:hypothetical protein